MPGVDGSQLSGVCPRLNNSHLFIEQRLQSAFEMGPHARRALQDFVGKEPAFARKLVAHFQLPTHIAQDFLKRIAGRVKLAKRIKPCVHELVEQRDVDIRLAIEVVEDVGFAQPGFVGDLIERPDLASRAVILELEAIRERDMISERDYWRDFGKARPRIFGGILNLMVEAYREATGDAGIETSDIDAAWFGITGGACSNVG